MLYLRIKMMGVAAAAFVLIFAGCGAVSELSAPQEIQEIPAQEIQDVIDPELENVLESASPSESIPVIVTLKGRPGSSPTVVKSLLKSRAIEDIQTLWIINGMALKANADAIRELAVQPEVESIRIDATLAAPQPLAAGGGAPSDGWNLGDIRAPEFWAMGYTGAGVVVATMDTGADADHPDLAAKWRGGANSWFDPNGEHGTPHDASGHGTSVMGIIVGGNSSGAPIGVAPGAQWIAVKIFNDAGVTTYSKIHMGFQWLLDPDGNPATDDKPDVVNNSWGLREFVNDCITEFEPDVAALKAAGIALTFSAGNEGPASATSISPANYAESFATGATNDTRTIASFSSRGPSACVASTYPEIVAPGVNVKTADLTYGGTFPDSYTYLSGTSFASAHVAGAMALLLSADPFATVSELESGLKYGALPPGTGGKDNIYGYGLLDVVGAHEMLVNPPDCTDADGDGYFADPLCRTEPDCNDSDASIHPNAQETKHDAIDQDCNGYDLTIDVVSANYSYMTRRLRVEASSEFGTGADLELMGYGPMIWNPSSSKWETTVTGISRFPRRVTVTGIEGAQSSITRISRRQF